MSMETENDSHGLNSKVVFFLLLAILALPTLFFVAKSYAQLNTILEEIKKPIALKAPMLLSQDTQALIRTDRAQFDSLARVTLEHDIMTYRHQRTTAFLATRTWIRFMSLMFGAILVVIGGGFVLGRISAPSFSGQFSFKDAGASVATSSPGLVLVICGIILISIPNLSAQRIETDDTSSYFAQSSNAIEPSKEAVEKSISEIKSKFNLTLR